MHCGVMVTGYNQGDWPRLMAEDYDRPPAITDASNMDDTLYMGRTGRTAGVRFDLGNRTLRFCLFDAAQPSAVPSVLGRQNDSC